MARKWPYHGITGPSPVFLGLFVFSGGAGMGGDGAAGGVPGSLGA